jgi:hypothetical protein
MSDSVHFIPNKPEELRLTTSEGTLDGRQVTWILADGRRLTVSLDIAAQINMLELQPGESFFICKDRKPGGGLGLGVTSFRVWLSPETEQARARQEDEALERTLARSIENVRRNEPPALTPKPARKPARKPHQQATAPVLIDCRGTGTDGPAPLPHVAIPVSLPDKPQRPTRPTVPYDVAFAEVTAFVTSGLKQAGEQWNDEAKQGMISTILIAAAKQGLLSLWERPNA